MACVLLSNRCTCIASNVGRAKIKRLGVHPRRAGKKNWKRKKRKKRPAAFFFAQANRNSRILSNPSRSHPPARTAGRCEIQPTYAVQIDCSQYHPYSLVLQVQLPLPMSHVEQQMSGPTVKTSKHCTHLPSVGKKRTGGREEEGKSGWNGQGSVEGGAFWNRGPGQG